ncbi:hypothetical protein CY35_09G030300 [Sphagnum magellanicum]|nr:hypothetical protein CY35_09G030300 [Sphagnum magellanicum]
MRRSTLSTISPSQLNRRASGSNAAARMLGKQSRLSSGIPMPGGVNKLGGPPNLPRRSSMHGKVSQLRVDSRPINEKSFQHDCIRKLTAYLTTHGYNVAISTKLLAAPSSKEVLNIVQFLFHQLDPNFKFSAKLEEDVPLMFKRVGYPSQISKSALYAAGSPHTWPGLLAALAWLVDLLVYQEKKETGDEEAPFDDNGSKLILEYANRSYECFLGGDDDECERLDIEFKKQFDDSKLQLDDKKQKLEKLATEVQAKLQTLKKQPSALLTQQSRNADFLSDIAKFDHINSNLQSHLQAAEKKLEDRRQELVAKKAEREAILTGNEELKQRIAAQQINSVDVERMRKENEVLDTNLQQVVARGRELLDAAWDYEVQASTKLKELEQIVALFTQQANKWKLIFGDPHIDNGGQFHIKLNLEADAPYDILGGPLKGVVKPVIRGVMESSKRLTNQEKDETLALMQQVHEADVACQEKIEQIKQCTVFHRKLEAQYNALKDDLDTNLASKIAEREALKSSMAEKERLLKRSEAEAEEHFKQWEFKYQMGVASCNLELAEKKDEWADMVTMILNAKENSDMALKNLANLAAQALETVKQQLSSDDLSWTSQPLRLE